MAARQSNPNADEYFPVHVRCPHNEKAYLNPYADESHQPSPHLWTALQFQAESDPDASLQKALTPPPQANPMKSQNENS